MREKGQTVADLLPERQQKVARKAEWTGGVAELDRTIAEVERKLRALQQWVCCTLKVEAPQDSVVETVEEKKDEAEAVAEEEEEEAAAESAPAESAQDASEAWIDKGRWVVRGIYAEHLRLLNYLVLLLPKVGDRSPAEEDEAAPKSKPRAKGKAAPKAKKKAKKTADKKRSDSAEIDALARGIADDTQADKKKGLLSFFGL
eukprot:g4187.t1